MSRKIRLGNDIDITWSLLDKDEQPYIVEGRDFAVEIHIGKKRFKISDAEASGNSIHFIYYGKDQKVTGPATLVYIENGGRVDMVTFDTKDVFTMVEHSWLAVDSDEQPETVTLDVVTVLSNLESSIGPRGYSAYEIAVQNGYTGTEEEWLASLKPHITADADGNVYCDGELLTDVIYSVVSAVTVGEQGRQEAEATRQTQETARQTAEGRRATAEEGRATAESGRVSAEQSRVAAEAARAGQSSSDHQRAENDHSRAEQDHQATANAVLYTPQSLTAEQKTQARTNIGAGTYSKPSDGIPATDLENGVIPDISGKADKEGEFPDMLVGTAESLLGTGSQVSDFVFSPMPGADGIAKLNAARGKSLVWNQLVQNGNFADGNTGWNNSLVVVNNEATRTLASGGTNMQFYTHASKISEHKYYIRCSFKCSNVSGITMFRHIWYGGGNLSTNLTNRLPSENNKWEDISFIVTGNVNGDNGEFNFYFDVGSNAADGDTITARNIFCVDLTLMFGAGNEPSSVAEFEAMFPLSYYDYEPGRIISNKTEEVKVAGFNQWDKRQIQNGYINDADGGVKTNLPGRNTGYIEILPNTTYFIKSDAPNGRWGAWYDANKNYISGVTGIGDGKVSPSNARYLRFTIDYNGNSGNPDTFCINISDPAKNGTYEPYKTNTIQLNLPTLTGKLNGEGESVVVFPDGLKSAGSVYDEIVGNKAIKRVGVVDLGSLSWNVGNAAGGFYASTGNIGRKSSSNNLLVRKYATISSTNTFTDKSICQRPGSGNENWINAFDSAYANNTGTQFKAAMSGVLLYYELATPVEYILDEPLPGTFRGYKGGTIKQIPENTSVPVTAPMVMEATYPVEAKLEPEIFWATYGVTTAQDILDAIDENKFVLCVEDAKYIYTLALISSQTIIFGFCYSRNGRFVQVNKQTNAWSGGIVTMESEANKSQSIETDKTSTTKYPSTKAVWDELKVRPVMDSTSQETVPSLNLENTANKSQDVQTDRESIVKYPSVKAVFDSLGKWGVVKQTLTWTGDNSTGYTYTISGVQWGLVPQPLIDEVAVDGVVFNEQTGYFEYCGYTDLSEDEILYARVRRVAGMCASGYRGYMGRIILPYIQVNGGTSEMFYGANRIKVIPQPYGYSVYAVNGFFFAYMTNLETIDFVLYGSGSGLPNTNVFVGCRSLTNIRFSSLTKNIFLNDSPNVSLESIVYTTEHSNPSSAITITLHADAYARCQADTTEYTYNGQTYTGIIAYAAAKNITIASA